MPRGCEATEDGGGQTCDTAEGAKNPWIRSGRQWNLNLATFNTRTLSSEASLAGLFEELSGIAWDIIGLSEFRRTGEAYAVLTNGHVLCYRGLPDKKESAVGFLVHNNVAGHIDEFYSINERVAVVIKLNRRYRMKVVSLSLKKERNSTSRTTMLLIIL